MPSFLNPIVGLLMLRARIEDDTVAGPDVRTGRQVSALACPGSGPVRRRTPRAATALPVPSSCARRYTPGRRWAARPRSTSRCASADPGVRSHSAPTPPTTSA